MAVLPGDSWSESFLMANSFIRTSDNTFDLAICVAANAIHGPIISRSVRRGPAITIGWWRRPQAQDQELLAALDLQRHDALPASSPVPVDEGTRLSRAQY